MSRPLDLFVPSRTLNATPVQPWRSDTGDLIAPTVTQSPKRPQRRRSLWRGFRNLSVFCVIVGAAVLVAFPQVRAAAAAAWPTMAPSEAFGASHVRILVMGADRDYGTHGERIAGSGRSDTLILAEFDLEGNTVHLVSIPRDTEAAIPHHGTRKINAAYALGGPDLARQTVENLFGAPVDHVVTVNLDAFRGAVDALGGVDVTVDKPLRYTDNWANLKIDIPAGPCHLDGEHAMQFVRFRHDAMADIGRVKRQQDFMRAVGAALKRPGSVAAWPGVVHAVTANTQTDLTAAQMIALGRFARSLPSGALTTETLPGRFHRSGWQPDQEGLRRIAARW